MPRTHADGRPKGKCTAYAFFVQNCREEHKRSYPDQSVVFTEFTRRCADRWKQMNDSDKKRFQDMADRDKKRYELEMQDYVPPKGSPIRTGKGSRGGKGSRHKDPNQPKRALSAFFWFCGDHRATIKARNPNYGIGDVAKELGKMWATIDPNSKQHYVGLAQKDKQRYDQEMAMYKNRQPVSQPIAYGHDDEDDDMEDEDDEDDE